jgi:hypothetical protein
VGGLVATTDRFGTPDGAYLFNGINSYVLVPNSASLSSASAAVTQSAWIKLNGMSLVGQAFGPITMKSNLTPNQFMYRMLATHTGVGVAFNNWFNGYSGAADLGLEDWYHVASVFDGSSVRFYVNGARVDSVAAPTVIAVDANDLTIGGDVPGILEIFNGKIDDVRIYARALTDEDVAELCGCGVVGVLEGSALPRASIVRAFPNPMRAGTRVSLQAARSTQLRLVVLDVAGRLVTTLADGRIPAGAHMVAWDGRDRSDHAVPSGVYFLRLTGDGVEQTEKVTVRR